MKRTVKFFLLLAMLMAVLSAGVLADEEFPEQEAVPAAGAMTASAQEPAADSAGDNTSEEAASGGASSETTAASDVKINSTNFPDASFRSFVKKTYDTNGDGTLSAAEQAIDGQYIDCRDLGISSLTGIEYLTGYTRLQCSGNSLKTLPAGLSTSLTLLECIDNQLTSLDVSALTQLNYLWCGANSLKVLDVSHNTQLKYLSCYKNQLTALDVTMLSGLETLCCWENQLTALDLTHNTALTHLECELNSLKALNLSQNTALTEVDCGYNPLGTLDVSRNTELTALRCYQNQLAALDVSKNKKLTLLFCWGNQLTALNVTGNTKLTTLNCSQNLLTSLNISANTGLTALQCDENQLTTLDISRSKGLDPADTASLTYDSDQTILITFLFDDVQNPGNYYYAPVYWAYGHNPQITGGLTTSTFAPNNTCTRAQVVTFLWRAAGKPEPVSSSSRFTDVVSGKYYYKAVLWAVEQGITNGYSDGTFRPNDTVTRGQFVTFLWRYAKKPSPTSSVSSFTDVQNTNAYYYHAVLWAAEQNVTSGYSDGTFRPGNTCSRANVVTFLYRYCK